VFGKGFANVFHRAGSLFILYDFQLRVDFSLFDTLDNLRELLRSEFSFESKTVEELKIREVLENGFGLNGLIAGELELLRNHGTETVVHVLN
jgi:hypothetical protein